MSQITGKCIIRLNGSELQSTDDATLNVGGVNREAVVGGGKVYGYKEETVAPTLECSVAHDKNTDLVALSRPPRMPPSSLNRTPVTNMYCAVPFMTEPASLQTTNGTASLNWSALSCERM